ncbi:hypothetical protein DMENIID0001_143460 [Sergentomyia squamirostris]
MSVALSGNRGSKVSPSPAKGSTVAYGETEIKPNVLAIPLSAIHANTADESVCKVDLQEKMHKCTSGFYSFSSFL